MTVINKRNITNRYSEEKTYIRRTKLTGTYWKLKIYTRMKIYTQTDSNKYMINIGKGNIQDNMQEDGGK